MIPPKGFVNSLKGLDPLLNVRYGDFIRQWVIERKSPVTQAEMDSLVRREARLRRILGNSADLHPNQLAKNEASWIGVSEQWVSAKRGYRVILFTPHLGPRIYDALVLADIKRYGGYAAFADHIEAAEIKREKDIDRQLANKQNALNKEAYDMLQFIWRKRSDALANGQRDMRYLLHGKHTKKGDSPIIQLTDF